jgi:agmatine/peptidylarginine deiminase
MISAVFRLPAEWEPQDGVLLAWPHAGTDWAPRLEQVEATCASLIAAISRYERVVLCVAGSAVGAPPPPRRGNPGAAGVTGTR